MSEKPIYTEEIHANRLRDMFEKEKFCNCPAAPFYNPSDCPNELWYYSKEDEDTDPCNVCREFLGINAPYQKCPCHALGKEEAEKRTWKRLNKYFGT